MIALFCLCLALFVSPFKSKSRLEAENAALRHQLVILRRKVRGRVRLTDGDRLFFIQLYRWFPSALKAITIVRPETPVRWHRAGFRRYWRWKSRSLGGRPQIDGDMRALIRRMSVEIRCGERRASTVGSGLRRYRHPPITDHGNPRQADCPRLAMAERLRRKADRIDSSRVR